MMSRRARMLVAVMVMEGVAVSTAMTAPAVTGAKKPPNGGKEQPVAVKCVDCKRPPNG